MAEEKTLNMICVNCPVGCDIKVAVRDGEVVAVEGNSCPRALAFAKKEISNPVRVFATTVRVEGGKLPVCPVRSRGPVPKDKVFEISREVARHVVKAPVEIGQVILPDVCGTGVDIIASRSLEAR
jgi:CxxC motif-containing protein